MTELTDAEVFGAPPTAAAAQVAPQAGSGAVVDAPSGAALNAAQTAYYVNLAKSGNFDPKNVPPHQVKEGEEPSSGNFVDLSGNLRQAGQPAATKEMSDADVFGAAPPAAAQAPIDLRPTSQGLGLEEGFHTVGRNLVDMLSGGIPGLPQNTIAKAGASVLSLPFRMALGADQANIDRQEKTYKPGMIGRIGGEVLGGAPFAEEELGAIPLGLLQGALSSDASGSDPLGKIRDLAGGAIAGKLGGLGVAGIKGVVSPVVRPAAQWAMDNSIRLNPGKILGGIPATLENWLSKTPLAGGMIRNGEGQTLDDFGRATYNNLMTPAGIAPLPTTIPAGNAANAAAHKAFSAAYDRVLPPLTLARDAAFDDGLSDIQGAGAKLGPMQGSYDALVRDGLSRLGPNGQMSGTDFKDFDTQLGQEIRAASRDPALMSQKYGDAVQDLQAHFRDALERSNPDQAPVLSALNRGYAGLVTADKAAVAKATDGGRFTPDDLIRAGRATDYSNRKTSTAAGEAMLQDWANAAKDNGVPAKVPSGAPLAGLALESLVGAGVAKESGLIKGAGGMAALEALLAGMYTRPALSVIRPALTQRPAFAKTVGDVLKTIQPIGAYGAATAAPNLLPMLPALPGGVTN